jgi:dolichol-phosphate mannosyltransferase
MLFPRRLAAVSDPMSGFFLIRRDRLPLAALQPQGFKILLEVLVRGWPLRVAEVPYTFGERLAGTSKASPREGLRYLAHLLRLRGGRQPYRLVQFALVGASGLLVNTLLLAGLTEYAGVHYLLSAIVSTEVSIAWNYLFCELWVFTASSRRGWQTRLVAFALLNNAALAAGVPLLWFLVSQAYTQYLTANLISIVALMLVRFAVSELVIWRRGDIGQFGVALEPAGG